MTISRSDRREPQQHIHRSKRLWSRTDHFRQRQITSVLRRQQQPGLTPGLVQTRSHERPFSRPFFLIGSDARSRQWLKNHRDRLKVIGAVGMLVQADKLDDLRTIAELADGLSILPASGSDIAQALSISHYPVLISAHGIEQ